MKREHKRYAGLGTVRQSYMKEYLINCPKCNKEASVTVDNPFWQNNGKLMCHNCHYSQKRDDLLRFNAIVKRNCDNCGKSIDQCVPGNREKVESIAFPCTHCGVTRTFKPRNAEYYLTYDSPGSTDPLFKLPLWLQYDIRGKSFWAFNRKHLNEILDYVSSTLRERKAKDYSTMVERLPSFIKNAKNRDIVIKTAERLLSK